MLDEKFSHVAKTERLLSGKLAIVICQWPKFSVSVQSGEIAHLRGHPKHHREDQGLHFHEYSKEKLVSSRKHASICVTITGCLFKELAVWVSVFPSEF